MGYLKHKNYQRIKKQLNGATSLILLITILNLAASSSAQGQSQTIALDRGRLWHSFFYGQECEPMLEWKRNTYGLDWPGFDTKELKVNIGGSNSYLVSGGFFITALNDTGAVWGWDDFAVNSRSRVGWSGANYRYLVKKHAKRWTNGQNFWLAENAREAEEIIETKFEKNLAWYVSNTDNFNLPISVLRTVRQWSGSKADEDYVIVEYEIANIRREFFGRDTIPMPLKGVYLLYSYALSPNYRGWNLKFPNFIDGARNTRSAYNPANKTLTAWAGDYLDSPTQDESFDYFVHSELDPLTDTYYEKPEFIAPGFMGIKFLHISADSSGQENRINGFRWCAASATDDYGGPFLDVAGLDNKYMAMANPDLLTGAFDSPDDQAMGRNRLYATFSLGPFNMVPNDTIRIVVAEFVGGLPYEQSIDPTTTAADVQAAGDSAVAYLSDRVQFNYNHNFTVPMCPPAPKFSAEAIDSAGVVANVISFSDSLESVYDPHQGEPDLAGYKIYRSWNYPFGPWEEIAQITKGDDAYYHQQTGRYSFIDRKVALGYGYYYSVTAYDNGHASWTVDPSVVVPPLESSIFANRLKAVYKTTLLPQKRSLKKVTVVPNPFYRRSGLPQDGDQNLIQFVDISQKCTIRIYTLRGDLVKTIRHDNPAAGTVSWNQISDNGQYIKSGMYFFHIENEFGDVQKGKFAIVK